MRGMRWAGLLVAAAACSSEKAKRVDLPLVVDSAGLSAATNDLGWTVTVTRFRAAVSDFQFTVEGETHTASLWDRIGDFFVGTAHAHPGHYAGGDVTGELPGNFVLDWMTPGPIGTATLLEGDYTGANLTFRHAGAADGLNAADPLLGHTFDIAGTATLGAVTISFTAIVDVDEGTQMVGAPFDLHVIDGLEATIGAQALTTDPFEPDTMFDGVDFGAADTDGDGQVAIAPGQDVHNILRRNVQVHDYYRMTVN